ncbi:MAG: GGDEF domain-containing protein, partial [Planctomycetota bacterium]|nr:GGDEF domain-containing protein [Planctomycetota bacterium]
GAFQHIAKPYENQHLLAVIERMVRLRRREREAAANAEKYYAIFNHLPLEVIQVGPDLRIREMNAVFRAHCPSCREGDSIIAAGFDLPPFEEGQHPAARALATGENQETTVQARRGGRSLYLRIFATPLKDEDGAVSGIVVMIDDITSEEQTRQNLQRQIERHTRAMQWQDELAMRLMIYQKELKQKNLELEEAKKELERLSVTDPLTLLHNRRYFDNIFPQEARRCSRYNHPLSVLYLDIDHFKSVNDNFGHAAGDAVLKELAALLRKHLRETDTVARYGGEEFVALLPETTIDIAAAIGERLRLAVEKHPFPIDDRQTRPLTISIGAASASGQMIDHQVLLARADAACYRAKAAGRNKVVCDIDGAQTRDAT